MKDPPQVFLTAAQTMTIGTSLKLTARVSGCQTVRGVEISNNGTRLISIDSPATQPFVIELAPTLFDPLYNKLGIALNLTLRARGICDDGRENTSSGLGLSFFPVEAVVAPVAGNQTALPDSFIAEGGVGSTPTTFLGCVGLAAGTTGLARFDTAGNATGANTMPPFDCSYASAFTNKSAATGTRWLMEPGVGAFSFNAGLDILSSQKLPITHIGVGPDGDAIVNNPLALPDPLMFRVPSGAGTHAAWGTQVNGIMFADPVVSQGEVRVASFLLPIVGHIGTVLVTRYSYDTGLKLSQNSLATIDFGEFNPVVVPIGSFSTDGKVLYFSYANNKTTPVSSYVAACASDSAVGCLTGGVGSWQTPLPGIVAAAPPFANGTMIAAMAGTTTTMLSATTGQIVNRPVAPGGTLVTIAALPGNGSDLYLFNRPANGSFPTELVAIDSPANGELWRVQIEGGQTPLTGVYVAVDDGNNAWLRIGANLVKPSSLMQYRTRKGVNPDGG